MRSGRFLAAGLLLALAATLVLRVFQLRTNGWNAPRIAPAIALFDGYPLYTVPEQGPITGNIYGPIGTLVYAPAVFGSTSQSAITIGTVIAALLYFGPVAWLLGGLRGGQSVLSGIMLPLALFVILTVFTDPLNNCAFLVHADAPALGLSCLAIGCLVRLKNPTAAFIAAAELATLAFWSKLTAAAIFPAILLAGWRGNDFRTRFRLLTCLLLGGTVITLLILAGSGFRETWFNVFTVPMSIPWTTPGTWEPNSMRPEYYPDSLSIRLTALSASAANFAANAGLVLIALLITVYGVRKYHSGPNALSGQQRLASTALAVAFLLSMPLAIASRAKVGGDLNSLGFSFYFGAVLATVLMQSLLERTANQRIPVVGSVMSMAMLLVAIGLSVRTIAHHAEHPDCIEQAIRFAEHHPGEAWFPWYPLANVMAEDKLYHFAYGLFDRDLAGYRPRDLRELCGLPKNLRYVCFEEAGNLIPESYFLSYLPGFRRLMQLEELPGWRVYVRDD